MTRDWFPSCAIAILAGCMPSAGAANGTISMNGWTVSTAPRIGNLTIAADGLGSVMRKVQIGLRGRKTFGTWTAQAEGNRLSIRTEAPRTGWLLTLESDALVVSCTRNDGFLEAEVPAPSSRIVARTMDTQGVPVDWTGTPEVSTVYGGEMTRNRSYLPREIPDVMYFSLGQVSGLTLHSLFDRKTDTAIDFPSDAVLTRPASDPEVLLLRMPVRGNSAVRIRRDYFAKTLGLPYYAPFDDRIFPRAPMVWSSWPSYYSEAREADIVRNTDWLAANLKAFGFDFVQLDDGYDRDAKGRHYWIERWDERKFPHGPQWLTSYIRSKGLRAGIWLVPNAYAGAVEQHPEWYLRLKADGSILKVYDTPALDASNPQALEQVRKIMTTLAEWGFDYFKFDGEHALARYIPGIDRSKMYDRQADPLANYRKRVQVIREAVGPNRFIEGCPAGTPLNGIGSFDSYFNGQDVYENWQGMFPLFGSINSNAFLNHLVVYLMPGEGIELGTPMTLEEARAKRPKVVQEIEQNRESPVTGLGLTDAEARTAVTYVALTGVVYPLASIMPELPAERVRLLKQTMPTLPILPVDLFSRGADTRFDLFKHTTAEYYVHNFPEILDLKVNSTAGVYDVVGLTNWQGEAAVRRLDFAEKLGLERGQEYVAFDFWNQRLLGSFKNSLDARVEPHDTRVLLIHAKSDHPQVIGNSRHISGAYSIRELAWDTASQKLHGISEAIAGEPYTLFIHVPAGYKAAETRTSAGPATLDASSQTGVVRLTLPDRNEPVKWEVGFLRVNDH